MAAHRFPQNFALVVITWYTFPETGALSLEATDMLFTGRPSPSDVDQSVTEYTTWRAAVKRSIQVHRDMRRRRQRQSDVIDQTFAADRGEKAKGDQVVHEEMGHRRGALAGPE